MSDAIYFAHPYVSNSKLGQLAKDLSTEDQYDATDNFRLGTMVDAFVTAPKTVDWLRFKIIGQTYDYTQKEFDTGRRMRDAALKDSFLGDFLKVCKFQTEYYSPDEPFYWNEVNFKLNIKCKYDLDYQPADMGGDIKSTAATTYAGFVQQCQRLCYPRGRYFYMRNSKYKMDFISGISKVFPHRVFNVFIKENSDLYMEGKHDCHELAFKYHSLYGNPTVHNFVNK